MPTAPYPPLPAPMRRLRPAGGGGPLHGVPLAHKDMFYRAGKVSGFGSKICRSYVADDTSAVMARVDGAER